MINSAWFVIKDGINLLLCNTEGEIVPCQTELMIKQNAGEFATCTATFLVNICSKEEMLSYINAKKDSEIREKASKIIAQFNESRNT